MAIPPIVLMIHGMGTHHQLDEENAEVQVAQAEQDSDNGLTSTQREVVTGINETAKLFGIEGYKFEEKVELREFNYSKYLHDVLMKDKQKAEALKDNIASLTGFGMGADLANELISQLAGISNDKFFYTHWMDIIYYGLTSHGEIIRNNLARDLNKIISEAQPGQDIHIIAHSLGTAVLYDTITKWLKKDANYSAENPELDVDNFKFKSIYMFANVSRLVNLLNDIGDPERSVLNSGPGGCSELFYNIFNEFDPFTWIKRWDGEILGNGYNKRVTTVRKLNTHDLQEYVSTPAACRWMMTNITGDYIDLETLVKAKKQFEAHPDNLPQDLENVEYEFSKVRSPSVGIGKIQAIIKLFKSVHNAYDTAERLKEGF
ncbi:MAG: hypothetical protein ABJV04_02845 [Aliiglaciecola sp.]|uniref:hypothetical protein n=1 Tax=Aliiglaciecola sp. TaxID=1872441 RepID=UPI0032986BFA